MDKRACAQLPLILLIWYIEARLAVPPGGRGFVAHGGVVRFVQYLI